MAIAPLMPKATAVWLVENTALSFDQIAQFCNLHPLEVKAIADGDAAQGIKGLDPILTGQLTREEIAEAEADPEHRLHIADPKVRLPEAKPKKGPRYTPVSRRQDRPNAILWLVRNHPELKDSQIMRLVGTTKSTIPAIRERTHWNSTNLTPLDPVTLGLCSQIDLDLEVQTGRQGKAGAGRGAGRDAAARLGHHRAEGGARAGSREEVPRSSTSKRCSPSSSRSARPNSPPLYCRRLFVANKLAAAPLQLRGIAAQRIGFGQQTDDAALAIGIDDRKRLRLGAIERLHGLLDRHARKQHVPGIVEQILDRLVRRDFRRVGVGNADHAGVTLLLVDGDDSRRLSRAEMLRGRRRCVVAAGTVRTSWRIILPTVRSRIQPISAALRMVSPRRWKRQVANE